MRPLQHYRRTSAARRTAFDISAKKEEMLVLEYEMRQPGFWDNQERARSASERLAALKEQAATWEQLVSESTELKELSLLEHDEAFTKELEKRLHALQKTFRAEERGVFLSGAHDKGGARLSVVAGAGGDDAEDWAAMLFSMYQRFSGKHRWMFTVTHEHRNEHNGVKNATAEITGAYAYGLLRREFGVHRLVRISPFSAKRQRHTSFALVEILPLEVAAEEIALKDDDLRTDFARSSGPGGQNVNKRETAVRITHLPTGIQVHVDSERSQQQNRERAKALLRAKLYQYEQARREEERLLLRGGTIPDVAWGHQIRSYVLHPYRLVKDHRTEYETSDVDAMLAGELDDFIEAELAL